MKTYPPHIEALRAAWTASNLSKYQIASRAGVSYGVVIQILQGGSYSAAKLRKVQVALGLKVEAPTMGSPSKSATVEQPTQAEPCAICRTPTARIYRPDNVHLCSPECIQLQAEATSTPSPRPVAQGEQAIAYRQTLDQQLTAAQTAVTEARAALAHTHETGVLERNLTQALTLISGARFALNQEGL